MEFARWKPITFPRPWAQSDQGGHGGGFQAISRRLNGPALSLEASPRHGPLPRPQIPAVIAFDTFCGWGERVGDGGVTREGVWGPGAEPADITAASVTA